jgi:hypothetical protein
LPARSLVSSTRLVRPLGGMHIPGLSLDMKMPG